MGEDWSNIEIEVIVAEYFIMLKEEIAEKKYNKSEHRRKIAPLLTNRSEGSIEFKLQNISAILSEIGAPWINGYKPRTNYQIPLAERVIEYLKQNPSIELTFKHFAETAANEKSLALLDYGSLEDSPPERTLVQEPKLSYNKKPIKLNYLEIEQNNTRLGKSGEEVALNYEKWRLINSGKESLADKIEWVAKTKGDGLGFDILSKNLNGTDRFIEVKTTKLGKDSPIFFSKKEFEFSTDRSSHYFLYRLFNFNKAPKVFVLHGSFSDFCRPEAINFKGTF